MGVLDTVSAALGIGRRGAGQAQSIALAGRVSRRAMQSRVVTELPLYQQLQRIGGSLTPRDVSDIIRQADNGYMWRLVDLANEARQKDGHLQSVLQTRETALTGLEWQIVPAQAIGAKAPKARDQRIAAFCEEHLRRVDALPHLISHLAGANYYGYAVSEILWRKVQGKLVPYGFDPMSPRRFVFDIHTGTLRWCDINAGMAYPGVELQKDYPGQFIQFQPRVNGDVPVREGLVRVLMWAALFRNWTTRDWLSLAELAWKPWRTGSYAKGASQEDIDNLAAILDGMSASGVAVYPQNTEVKIEWPKSSTTGTSAHGELFSVLGSEMSKAVLGQTLTTEQGKVGSQALGKVHNEVRKDLLLSDARAIASVLARDALTPMVRMNFGAQADVPTFRFVTDDATDLEQFSSMIQRFWEVGLRMPAKHIRRVAGIPDPQDDEECIGGTPPADDEDPNDPAPDDDPSPPPVGDETPDDGAGSGDGVDDPPENEPGESPKPAKAA